MGSETLPSPVTYFPTNLVYPIVTFSDESSIPFYSTSNGYNDIPSELIKKCYFQAFKFNSKFLKIQKKIFSIVDG